MDRQEPKDRNPQGEGRLSNTGNEKDQKSSSQDISQVDRQEGEMNNGETGMNTEEPVQKDK